MCSRWKTIEEALGVSVRTAGPGQFSELVARYEPALKRFADGRALLEHLHARDGSDEERDEILGALVSAAKRGGDPAGLARDLLWLALWPGLTALLRRTAAWASEGEDEAAAEIAEKFAVAIDRLELSGCRKVAATLLWNTRRQVYAVLKVRTLWHAIEAPLEEDVDPVAHTPAAADVVDALSDLEREAGADADLLLLCLVEGLTTREAACRCGCGREAVKKRLQRITARLRHHDVAANAKSDVPDR